tara:strand:+ start:342 stop:476 length:135 start_codon:yes stop_codon:yes gene_type:complete
MIAPIFEMRLTADSGINNQGNCGLCLDFVKFLGHRFSIGINGIF